MSQPVKLSDSLVLEARLAGKSLKRSIAGQVEFWAALGKSIEPLLRGSQVLALSRKDSLQSLSDVLKTVDTEKGRKRLRGVLKNRDFPHYEPVSGKKGLLVRILQDGQRTTGRFVNREFRPVKINGHLSAGKSPKK